jgi:hypothetical protein
VAGKKILPGPFKKYWINMYKVSKYKCIKLRKVFTDTCGDKKGQPHLKEDVQVKTEV